MINFMVEPTVREEIENRLSAIPDEKLKRVLDFVRSLTPENEIRPTRSRLKLRDILRLAGPELFPKA